MRIQVSPQRHGHGLSPSRRQPALQRPGVCGRGRGAVSCASPQPLASAWQTWALVRASLADRPSAPLRESFSRQLWLTQTPLSLLREGLLLLDDKELGQGGIQPSPGQAAQRSEAQQCWSSPRV